MCPNKYENWKYVFVEDTIKIHGYVIMLKNQYKPNKDTNGDAEIKVLKWHVFGSTHNLISILPF